MDQSIQEKATGILVAGPQAAPCQADAKAELASRYGIASAFMRVDQIEKILGITANSIRAQMREGRFPVAHRRVGNVVVVKLDDFAAWYSSPGAAKREEGVRARADFPDAPPPPAAMPMARASSRATIPPPNETAKEWADRIRLSARLAVGQGRIVDTVHRAQ